MQTPVHPELHQVSSQPEIRTLQSLPDSFREVKINPLSLQSVSQTQVGVSGEAQGGEFNPSYDRHKKIESKRATEIAIQKVANIIAKSQASEEPVTRDEAMEIEHEQWIFGATREGKQVS